ncbi:MAG: hypothetical protein HPY67_07455 [Syntrophaceae bacterium]|nr:hypothetical protein [Syntrophaceae bacterium]
MKKTSIALLVVCALLASTAQAFAEPPKDGMAIAADVLIARPVGLVSIVAGTAMFIVSLPFAIPSGSVETAGRLLVADPFKYTFERPLGDFDYKVGQAEMPKGR